jgi:hypothetical protein
LQVTSPPSFSLTMSLTLFSPVHVHLTTFCVSAWHV